MCGVCLHLPRRAARPSMGPLPRNPTLVSAASQRPTRRASLELAGVCLGIGVVACPCHVFLKCVSCISPVDV